MASSFSTGPAPSRKQLADPAFWERILEAVIETQTNREKPPQDLSVWVESVMRFRADSLRVVVLGGGTGMSNIVGETTPFPKSRTKSVGLKMEFGRMDVITCTTDDGGSTGELRKFLPIIGIGDLRKTCTALIMPQRLAQKYGLTSDHALRVMQMLRRIFAHRGASEAAASRYLKNPVMLLPKSLRAEMPKGLAATLQRWGNASAMIARACGMPLAKHCLGNLLILGALRCAGWKDIRFTPSLSLLQRGLDLIAKAIGAPRDTIHAVTHVPGQLCFRYANGVEVIGQSKAGYARRSFPVEYVHALYAEHPTVPASILRALRAADVIVYAPGSLYSSMIPVLQLPPVVEAIRRNKKALKLLAANFWIQEGETDISPQQFGRGFYVSDLLRAYECNVPGGTKGLFDVVLCSNLEHLPGNILRAYALEGKHPIHLNRREVEQAGYTPLEVRLFTPDPDERSGIVHHDPEKFALAVRTLLYLRMHSQREAAFPWRAVTGLSRRNVHALPHWPSVVPFRYREAMLKKLAKKRFSHAAVRSTFEDLIWEHRDIHPEHIEFFQAALVVPARHWQRSVEWDNVLGYYDPERECLFLHEALVSEPERLRRDLLIALGESLLGNYIEQRMWRDLGGVAGCYEIRLRPANARRCLLSDRDLRAYLRLARMARDSRDPLLYRMVVQAGEGFLPSGLLFGLMYAWYLDNRYVDVMEYEMSLLRWRGGTLIPHQEADRRRKEALVAFFRNTIFRHR